MPDYAWFFVFARRGRGGQGRARGRVVFVALLCLFLLLPGRVATAGWLLASAEPAAHQEGSGWRIVITGNHGLGQEELWRAAQAEIDTFLTREQPASAIDDAAFQMELAYRHAGYFQALVDYEIRPEGRMVQFSVREGSRLLLGEVVFQGNVALARERLLGLDPALAEAVRRQQPFPYVEEAVTSLAASIRALYLSEGYLEAQVRPPDPEDLPVQGGDGVPLVLVITEGPRYTIGSVEVRGDRPPALEAKIEAVVGEMRGLVYQRRQKLLLKTKLHDCYENAGYADVGIVVEDRLEAQCGLAHLTATVVSGQPVMVEEVRVTGNQRTSHEFIGSRLRLEPGLAYSLDGKRESFNELYQTGLFSNVDLTLADGSLPGHKTLQVDVRERKAREVYLEPGWGSYELLRLKSGYRDSNIFGSGRILRLDSALSLKGRSLEAGVSDPWFMGTDVTASLPFHYRYREEPSFTLENSGGDLFFIKKIHKNVTINLGYQYSKNVVTDIRPDVDLLGIESNYDTASLSAQLIRDTRDDMFFPTRGYRGNVALVAARPQFGGTIAYDRLQTGVRYFLPLANGAVLGLRFATGVVLPASGQQGIPVSERFFNGGESSVRSFQASRLGPVDAEGESLGGTAFTTYTVEWRKKLNDDLAWSLFYDLGNVSPNHGTVDGLSPLLADSADLSAATWRDYFSDLRSGLGVGLHYMLPVGPARLDLAMNPDRDPARDEPDYVVHFSIGMAF